MPNCPEADRAFAGEFGFGEGALTRKPIPKPSFLDRMQYLGFVHGARRWRHPKTKHLFTWDALHGEVEAFNPQGFHQGSLDPLSGDVIKRAVKGRRIDV